MATPDFPQPFFSSPNGAPPDSLSSGQERKQPSAPQIVKTQLVEAEEIPMARSTTLPFDSGQTEPATPPFDSVSSAPPVSPAALPPFNPESPGDQDVEKLSESELSAFLELYQRILREISKVFVGQTELVTGTLVALFSSGHVLIESVPGLGKTLFVRTLGKVLGCRFGRIQFTPDLMPSDITGGPIFDMKTQEFRFRPGPVFTQFLLADEINRSPAKTHAALLEIMQENSVTIDSTTHALDPPFFVLATQNPIESEGTYRLPEAQIDRFMFKLIVDYPSEEQERAILQHHGKHVAPQHVLDEIVPITNVSEILEKTQRINNIYIAPPLIDYINTIVRKTRHFPHLSLGASPRAGLALMQGCRTLAAFHGRAFVIPEDVVQLVLPTLRHRVTLSPEAEIEGQNVDFILTRLIRSVDVPRT